MTWRERLRLNRHCRRAKLGLLVTAHSPTHIPLLIRVNPGVRLVQKLNWMSEEGSSLGLVWPLLVLAIAQPLWCIFYAAAYDWRIPLPMRGALERAAVRWQAVAACVAGNPWSPARHRARRGSSRMPEPSRAS